jgi:hypothetical protein
VSHNFSGSIVEESPPAAADSIPVDGQAKRFAASTIDLGSTSYPGLMCHLYHALHTTLK